MDIEVTPIFLSTLLQQESESGEEVEPPLWVEVLISNEEESFSTTLTGSEWTRLVSSYGISRAGIMAFLRDRDRSREEWTEMEQVLNRILARQDDGVAFEEDDRVVRSLLDELITPQSVEFRVQGTLPPGVLFYGKKKKGKGGSTGQGGSKGQGGKKKTPRDNPGAGPGDGVSLRVVIWLTFVATCKKNCLTFFPLQQAHYLAGICWRFVLKVMPVVSGNSMWRRN